MRAAFRQLDAGEPDPELLALGASAGTAAWGCAWMVAGLPLPPCMFHAVTGCPCPTCGATRCVLALAHGRVAEAAGWNPLVCAGVVGLAVANVYAAAVLLTGLPRLRVSLGGREAAVLRAACVLAVLVNWGWVIGRGV